MAAFAGLKTTILGGVIALLLLAGIAGPGVARAASSGSGLDSGPAIVFQEGGAEGPTPVTDDSGDDDDVYIGLAAASFAALVLVGLSIGFFGLREN